MISNINPREFIKAQNDAKEAIIDAHLKGSIEYMENVPYCNADKSKILSPAIEKLIEFNVFDYDEYSYSLFLSDDYNSHLKTYTDINIKEIEEKHKIIINLIRDINFKRKDNQLYSSEIKRINSTIRNIKAIIYKAIQAINEKEIKFKAEIHFEVKKANLYDCKSDLIALSEAVRNTDDFLIKYTPYFIDDLGDESVSFHINQLAHHLHDVRENINRALNELSKYLIHVEKEAEKIKKLNHLYKLKLNGELFEKSNIESVFSKLNYIAEAIKIKIQYVNDETLIEKMSILAKEKKMFFDKRLKTEEIIFPPVKPSMQKTEKVKTILSTKKVYTSFIKQEKDLASFLGEKHLTKKQFLSIFIRITLQYSKFLLVSKKQIVEHNRIKLPYVSKRR